MSESPISHSQKRKARRRRLNRKQSVSETDDLNENRDADENGDPVEEQESEAASDDDLTWYMQWGSQRVATKSKKAPPTTKPTKTKKKILLDNKKIKTNNLQEKSVQRDLISNATATQIKGSHALCNGSVGDVNCDNNGWSDMTNLTKTFEKLKYSSTPNLNSASLPVNSKISKLVPGQTYTGVVEESHRQHFVVRVQGSVSVLVFMARFQPRGSSTTFGPEVMASSVLKNGDAVLLTAIPNKPSGKSGLQWVAQKCWQEDAASAVHKLSQDLQAVQAAVVQVKPRTVLFADGVSAVADNMFLFGFRLSHPKVDLIDVFERGHLMWYVLSSSRAAGSQPKVADLAWFGSLPAEEGSEVSLQQQYQVIKFIQGRVASRQSSLSEVVSFVCGLNKKAANVGTGLEAVYGDILGNQKLLPRMKEPVDGAIIHRGVPAVSTAHAVYGAASRRLAEPASAKTTKTTVKEKKKTKSSKKSLESVCKVTESIPSTCSLPQSMTAESRVRVPTASASTQTYATGDIVCCFTFDIDNGSSSE